MVYRWLAWLVSFEQQYTILGTRQQSFEYLVRTCTTCWSATLCLNIQASRPAYNQSLPMQTFLLSKCAYAQTLLTVQGKLCLLVQGCPHIKKDLLILPPRPAWLQLQNTSGKTRTVAF